MEGVILVLRTAFNLPLPFGFTLGTMVVYIFSIPLLVKFIKKIF